MQEGVKAQIATGIGNTASKPQGTCRLQRNSVPNDPRKDKRFWITTALSVEMLPDRENRAAGILENKCQNPRQTCMLVITAYKPLNVTLTKIRRTEMEGQRPPSYSDSEGPRVNIIIFRNLRNSAMPRKRGTTALLSSNIYLGFQLLIFHAISSAET